MRVLGYDISFASRGRPTTKDPQPRAELYPVYASRGGGNRADRPLPKPTSRNLRKFAEHPIMRRAIEIIKNEVLGLDWVVEAKRGAVMTPEMKAKADIIWDCLEMPNPDDDFIGFWGALLEDGMTMGGMTFETAMNANTEHPLWMWPVDVGSVDLVPFWNGNPKALRYAQRITAASAPRAFSDEQMVYIKPNKRTFTPFGLGPVEVAFNTMNAFLQVHTTGNKVAANHLPKVILNLGKDATPDQILDMRNWWEDDIEGTGVMPIMGGSEDPSVMRLQTGGIEDTQQKYQEFLIVIIANAFGLSPGKLGLAKDINRSTKEGQMEEDDDTGTRPWAKLMASAVTHHLIRKRFGEKKLCLRWKEKNASDDYTRAQTHQIYLQESVLSPDDVREEIGRGPMEGGRGSLTKSEVAQSNQPVQTQNQQEPVDPTLQNPRPSKQGVTK